MSVEQINQITTDPRPNAVLQGDCINIMRRFRSSSVDFVLSDPPYLAHYRSRDGRAVLNDGNSAWLKPAFAEVFRVLRRDSFCVSFYGWNQADKFIAAWREAGFRLAGHLTFIKRYPSGDLILDPLCGSGSSLLAAKLENRRFIGIELDATYCRIARHRLLPRAA